MNYTLIGYLPASCGVFFFFFFFFFFTQPLALCLRGIQLNFIDPQGAARSAAMAPLPSPAPRPVESVDALNSASDDVAYSVLLLSSSQAQTSGDSHRRWGQGTYPDHTSAVPRNKNRYEAGAQMPATTLTGKNLLRIDI